MKIQNIKHTLIGIAGKKGSGKDTVANYIKEKIHIVRSYNTQHIVPVVIYHFADPLKHAAAAAFGTDDICFRDEVLKEEVLQFWNLTPRRILQILGTECFRDKFHKDFWVKRAELELSKAKHYQVITIIPDVRFENEASFIRDRGGLIVHVFREDAEVQEKQEADKHRSEESLNINTEKDWIIESPTGVSILQERTEHLIRYIIGVEKETK